MCDYDADPPELFCETRPRARRVHRPCRPRALLGYRSYLPTGGHRSEIRMSRRLTPAPGSTIVSTDEAKMNTTYKRRSEPPGRTPGLVNLCVVTAGRFTTTRKEIQYQSGRPIPWVCFGVCLVLYALSLWFSERLSGDGGSPSSKAHPSGPPSPPITRERP